MTDEEIFYFFTMIANDLSFYTDVSRKAPKIVYRFSFTSCFETQS